MHPDALEHPAGYKFRYQAARLRNANRKSEARVVDRAKLFRGERLRLKAKPRRPKRKGHHGWRQQAVH